MIPRVAIQYPTAHKDVFEPLTDFEVWDSVRMQPDQIPDTTKEVWLDLSEVKDAPQYLVDWCHYASRGFQGVIVPTYKEPDRNVLSVARWPQTETQIIGIWRGERRHLKLMADACHVVSLPYYEYGRMSYVPDGESHKYHLYEFCSLDELRRYPIRSIHTSVSITAALVGIDLRTRERRPKRLPPFTYDLRLSDAQLDLAVQNVQAIREAVYGHYPDTNPKT